MEPAYQLPAGNGIVTPPVGGRQLTSGGGGRKEAGGAAEMETRVNARGRGNDNGGGEVLKSGHGYQWIGHSNRVTPYPKQFPNAVGVMLS